MPFKSMLHYKKKKYFTKLAISGQNNTGKYSNNSLYVLNKSVLVRITFNNNNITVHTIQKNKQC